MSKVKVGSEVVEIDAPVSEESVVPQNRFVDYYLGEGYQLSEFRTRSRDSVKQEATRLRQEGFLSAYAPLLKGFYGVFFKEAPVREAKAAKPSRKIVPLEVQSPTGEKISFESTKAARAFAAFLIESAKNAEFESDRTEALAAFTPLVEA